MENKLESIFKAQIQKHIDEKKRSYEIYNEFKENFGFLEGYGFRISNYKSTIKVTTPIDRVFITMTADNQYIMGKSNPMQPIACINIDEDIEWDWKGLQYEDLAAKFAEMWIANDEKNI